MVTIRVYISMQVSALVMKLRVSLAGVSRVDAGTQVAKTHENFPGFLLIST